MIGYPVYKFVHVLAIVALIAGLVTLLLPPGRPMAGGVGGSRTG